MTALVVLALTWPFLALATACVVGRGIRLADADGDVVTGGDKASGGGLEVTPAT